MSRSSSLADKMRQRKLSSDSEPSPAAKNFKMAGESKTKIVDLMTVLNAVHHENTLI